MNETFPSSHLTLADIESCWAGLRPLIHEEGKSASELSRKDEIFESSSGLISIAGGKLTGYRKMAERVVDLIIKRKFEDRKLAECTTDSMLLAGGGLKSVTEVASYNKEIATRVGTLGLKGDHAAYLVHLYGKQSDAIIGYAFQHPEPDPEITLALAELWFAVNNEMVAKLTDFCVRRTGLLYFNIHRLTKIQEPVLNAMATYFGWNEARTAKERGELEQLIVQTLNFKQ